MTQVTERQRSILEGAAIDGCVLSIAEQLDRADYNAVNKLLVNLGGKWDRRQKGHVFASDPTSAVARVLETGEVPRPARTAEGFVATPPDVAEWLVRHFTDLGDRDQRDVLEPSAGDGALVTAIRDMDPYANILALEPNQQRAACIPRDSTEVLQVRLEDYLHSSERTFDAIVANPPFSVPGRPTIWIDHTWHCWRLLAPGGQLTSVAPHGLVFREDRKHREVRTLIERYGGGWVDLDEGAFAESGTQVRAVVFWIDKPADWTPEADRTKKKRGKPSEEEKQERRTEDQQLREAATEALDDEEYVEDMERRLGRLPAGCRLLTYSPRNQALVLNQADALGIQVTGHLNTFRGWAEQGRVVVKWSTALRIIAAMGDEEEKPDDQQPEGEEKEPKKRFRVTTRFDWSQTKALDDE